MQVTAFEPYRAGVSLIHRLDPRVKVVITVIFIVSNVVLPDGAWLAFLLSWGLVLLVNSLARLKLAATLKRSLVALPFLLAAITIIFTLPGRPVVTFNLGPWVVTATDAGLTRFTSILVRSWLSIQMAILLTSTTRFPDLMHALHHLRVPAILVAVISFTYRYLFVLTEETLRLLRAREARSARPAGGGGGGSVPWRARVAGYMAGQLFVRSFERSERVYNAMLARGYTGQFFTLTPHVMRPLDWTMGGLAAVYLLFLQLVAHGPGL